MKQKFLLLKSEDQTELIIRELAELDTGKYSVICEEKHPAETIKNLMHDKTKVLEILRSNNMFPPSHMIERIINALPELYGAENKESLELFFDDIELIAKEAAAGLEMDEDSDDDSSIDDLLDSEVENEFIDDIDVKDEDPIDSSIDKISIDDSADDKQK